MAAVPGMSTPTVFLSASSQACSFQLYFSKTGLHLSLVSLSAIASVHVGKAKAGWRKRKNSVDTRKKNCIWDRYIYIYTERIKQFNVNMYHTHVLIYIHISLNRKFLFSCVCVCFSERTWTQTLPWVLTLSLFLWPSTPDFLKSTFNNQRKQLHPDWHTGCWSSILAVKWSGFQPREYNEIHIKIYLPNENPGVMHKWFSDNKMQI